MPDSTDQSNCQPAAGYSSRPRGLFNSGLSTSFVCVLAVVAFLCVAGDCFAQSWPDYPLPGPNEITRGTGQYFSWLKLIPLILLFLSWVWLVDWVSRDAQEYDTNFALWVPIVFFPFLLALFLGAFTIPIFAAGMTLTVLGLFGPMIAYVVARNGQVEYHEKVLTSAHLRYVASIVLAKLGINIAAEAQAAHQKGAQVEFTAMGGKDDQVDQANLLTSRQSPGFLPAKALIAGAVDHRAEKIMLDFTSDGVTSKYQVDGVWHDSDERDREEGDGMLEVFKRLAAAKPGERRARQKGKFQAKYNKKKHTCSLATQGTKTGERAVIAFEANKNLFATLEELGMREKMIADLKALMLSENGIILVSSMKAGGLSTSLSMTLRNTDRLLRDFIIIEDEANPAPEIENVDPVTYAAAKGESPAVKFEGVLRKQPDVIVVPEMPDKETAQAIVDAAKKEFLLFTTVRAKEAVEALLRVLLLKVPAKDFAPQVKCVLNQRLIRKLCETCKEPYEPPPALLKKLGIPKGRVEELFRHPEDPEKPCPDCHGIGYKGRTAIFELLTVDDMMREVLIKQPKLDILRKAARKAGNRTLQEEGILAVVKGVTSLPELMRVLKQ